MRRGRPASPVSSQPTCRLPRTPWLLNITTDWDSQESPPTSVALSDIDSRSITTRPPACPFGSAHELCRPRIFFFLPADHAGRIRHCRPPAGAYRCLRGIDPRVDPLL